MEPLTVHNTSRRSWLVAAMGTVLVIVALELLVGDGLVDLLAERVFLGEETTEARERMWAGIMGVVGAILVGWGVISGLRRRAALVLSPQGLEVALRGPLRPLDLLPWEEIQQVVSQQVDDGGTPLSSLTIILRSNDPGRRLPIDPWGARWTGGRILRVLATDWSVGPEAVAAVSNHYLDLAHQPAPAGDDE